MILHHCDFKPRTVGESATARELLTRGGSISSGSGEILNISLDHLMLGALPTPDSTTVGWVRRVPRGSILVSREPPTLRNGHAE